VIGRRTLLIASAASLAARAVRAGTSRDAELKDLLDRLQSGLPVPGPNWDKGFAAAIEALKGFNSQGLSALRRDELQAVRLGLELESRIGSGYAAALSFQLGGAVDPLAAHRRAQAEAGRLQARADRLLQAQGLASGTVGERLARLFADERWLYSDDGPGRDRAVAEMNAWSARIRPRLAPAFGDLAIPPAEARRMSPEDAARGRPGYREAGTFERPGAYYVDLKAIRSRPSWTLPAVVHHELIPGHLLQLPYQAAGAPHPLRLRVSRAYFEAWGVYAEQLAGDLGLMAQTPLAEIGTLHWRLFRLARIVADTGLHALGWSQDQAVAAMRRIQGPPIAFVDIPADVARMAGDPATFAAQGLYALELARLRPARGWPAFHRRAMAQGPWPIAALAGPVGPRR
jgi:uncharacterized protein (DUF885 family)